MSKDKIGKEQSDFISDFDKEIQRIKGGKCDYD